MSDHHHPLEPADPAAEAQRRLVGSVMAALDDGMCPVCVLGHAFGLEDQSAGLASQLADSLDEWRSTYVLGRLERILDELMLLVQDDPESLRAVLTAIDLGAEQLRKHLHRHDDD